MNHQEAYQQEFDRVRAEKMDHVMDVLADDIWVAMGRENEAPFEEAAREGDEAKMGRIMASAISTCIHRLVDWQRIDELTKGDERRETVARDYAERKRDVDEEARRAGL